MVMQKVHPAVKDGGKRNGCSHFWLIGEAHGESSAGVCRLCGEEREFFNWMSSLTMFGGDAIKSADGGRHRMEMRKGVSTPFNPINVAYELQDIRG